MAYWIFQGSPAKFRVGKYLKENRVIAWSLRQKEFRDDIQIGDEVYIWRADGNALGTAGVVAQGVIILRIFILLFGPIIIGVEGLHRDENAQQRKNRGRSVSWCNS